MSSSALLRLKMTMGHRGYVPGNLPATSMTSIDRSPLPVSPSPFSPLSLPIVSYQHQHQQQQQQDEHQRHAPSHVSLAFTNQLTSPVSPLSIGSGPVSPSSPSSPLATEVITHIYDVTSGGVSTRSWSPSSPVVLPVSPLLSNDVIRSDVATMIAVDAATRVITKTKKKQPSTSRRSTSTRRTSKPTKVSSISESLSSSVVVSSSSSSVVMNAAGRARGGPPASLFPRERRVRGTGYRAIRRRRQEALAAGLPLPPDLQPKRRSKQMIMLMQQAATAVPALPSITLMNTDNDTEL
jgi:hypothetical protein